MKTLYQLVTTFSLLVVLTSCINAPEVSIAPTPTVAIQIEQPTEVAIPTDLAFSTPLIQVLSRSGLSIMSVQHSKYVAIFPSTNQAVWVETNQGIVEAVFFSDSTEAEQIHITVQPNNGRYLYTMQAPPLTLLHDQTIDAAFPLYFTAKNDMLLITSSEELDKTLKHIFLGQ